jgi:hypothetical protein
LSVIFGLKSSLSVDIHSDDYIPPATGTFTPFWTDAHQALKRDGGQRFRVYF